jgi:hypothetical protein
VPVLPGAGLEQGDELVAEVDERAAVHAVHVPDREQPAVEGQCAIEVVHFERDVVDADRSRSRGLRVHDTTLGEDGSQFRRAIGPRTGTPRTAILRRRCPIHSVSR